MMRLLLVDGSYYAFRSFYAIKNLSNSKGEPTNAVYGYVKTLQRMVLDLKPDFAAVIFDDGLPAARMALQADYKAHRTETPEALLAQFPVIHAITEPLGFKRLSHYGEEADDLIASYAKVAMAQGIEVILATNDKDLMQLVNHTCKVYQTDKDMFKLLGAAELQEKWGIPPEKIGEILALTGDASDNIPGVPSIGPKIAAALINQFGSVNQLLESLDRVTSEKQRNVLKENIELIRLNQQMIRLRDELPLPAPIETLTLWPNYAELATFFKKLEFKTLLQQAEKHLPASQPQQTELF